MLAHAGAVADEHHAMMLAATDGVVMTARDDPMPMKNRGHYLSANITDISIYPIIRNAVVQFGVVSM